MKFNEPECRDSMDTIREVERDTRRGMIIAGTVIGLVAAYVLFAILLQQPG